MTPITRRDFLGKTSALALAAVALAETPRTLEFQPKPIESEAFRLDGSTTIRREWHPGDTARCRLCDDCHARRNVCVVVDFNVTDEEAYLFDSRGLPYYDEA
jgi:hypothetical protein